MAKENFEESMKKLETIVTELENGNLNILEDAEKKITILLEEDGELKEEKFETE